MNQKAKKIRTVIDGFWKEWKGSSEYSKYDVPKCFFIDMAIMYGYEQGKKEKSKAGGRVRWIENLKKN